MWLRHPQRGLPYLICSILIILVCLPFTIHYYLSNFGVDYDTDQFPSRHPKAESVVEEFGPVKTSDIRFQIQELKNIRASVNNELLELEKKRQMLQSLVASYNEAIDNLKLSYQTTNQELDRLKVTFRNLQAEHDELLHNKVPHIEAPRRILPTLDDDRVAPATSRSAARRCRMHSCFDYSRCSLTSQFPVYLYNPDDLAFSDLIEPDVKYSLTRGFDTSPHITYDPSIACLYVVIVGDVVVSTASSTTLGDHLRRLQYWNNGTNHILINLSRRSTDVNVLDRVDTGRSFVAQSSFSDSDLRTGFDVVLPPGLGISDGDVWDQLPMIVPARRKNLLMFSGEFIYDDSTLATFRSPRFDLTPSPDGNVPTKMNANLPSSADVTKFSAETNLKSGNGFLSDGMKMLLHVENSIVEILKSMQMKFESDGFYFEFICSGDNKRTVGINGEWALCGSDSYRTDLLKQSTFALIIAPTNISIVSTVLTQWRLYEALKNGAIPVILGDHVSLAFSEFVDWSKAVLRLPKARITELHFYVRTFNDADILEMRRNGRMIFEKFFGSVKSVVDTLLAVVRTRLKIPPFTMREEPSPSVFNDTFVPIKEVVVDALMDAEEILGPVEPPMNSPRFRRNFTITSDRFLLSDDPFHLFPFTPFEPVMPADAKFVGSEFGFRPIGHGVGGAGKEFGEALGGNNPREQFTVVILTYEREAVLINALARLKGLPHLNKVIVVWNNNVRLPSEDLRWPDIGVEVHVIRTSKNSLNNRFLPYDAIQTEAILSLDDDAHLRHDEIMFGFRIWREARDRIVGFPGRYNAWDLDHQTWLYNSNYSCELSMVLTGAAFFHKYYAFLYSYVMPQAIRDKVDEYLNCEDLAMNFLVAHITRKPPIKVTSRWTFRCPGCPKALSVEESHFHERHKCLNFFVQVYGYMPLLNTQYRADSVLFKTRIPHDKQKCFKFI